VQRVGEAPQLSHHQPPGAQLARDREAGAEPDAERCSRAPARECIVHPRPVGEPNIQPAIERLAHELGAIGAVQHGRLAPLAMRERQDHVPGAVERTTWDVAGRRGAIGTLRRPARRRAPGQHHAE